MLVGQRWASHVRHCTRHGFARQVGDPAVVLVPARGVADLRHAQVADRPQPGTTLHVTTHAAACCVRKPSVIRASSSGWE